MAVHRLPLTTDDLVHRLIDRGVIPSDAMVKRITIVADAKDSHVTMTVELLPDDRIIEAVV